MLVWTNEEDQMRFICMQFDGNFKEVFNRFCTGLGQVGNRYVKSINLIYSKFCVWPLCPSDHYVDSTIMQPTPPPPPNPPTPDHNILPTILSSRSLCLPEHFVIQKIMSFNHYVLSTNMSSRPPVLTYSFSPSLTACLTIYSCILVFFFK